MKDRTVKINGIVFEFIEIEEGLKIVAYEKSIKEKQQDQINDFLAGYDTYGEYLNLMRLKIANDEHQEIKKADSNEKADSENILQLVLEDDSAA